MGDLRLENVLKQIRVRIGSNWNSGDIMAVLACLNKPRTELLPVLKTLGRHDEFCKKTLSFLKILNPAITSELTSLEQAYHDVGYSKTFEALLSVVLAPLLNSALPLYQAPAGSLFQHSLKTALAARDISVYSRVPLATELVFTVALLHNAGKMFLDLFDEKKTFFDREIPLNFLDLELEVFGSTHPEAGYWVAKELGLPQSVQEGIRYHHEPNKAEESCRHLVYVIHLADIMAMMGGALIGLDAMGYRLDAGYENYVKLSSRDLEQILYRSSREQRDLQGLFE